MPIRLAQSKRIGRQRLYTRQARRKKIVILQDSVEIRATSEEIWDVSLHVENACQTWQPDDHKDFHRMKGKPLEEGSVAYFEE